jgi:glucokinase
MLTLRHGANFRFGAAKGKKDILLLTIGTGVGGGIVIDGKLHRGAYGIAAEVGHMRVVPDGLLCGCQARGCLEQYAAGSALMRYVREGAEKSPDAARALLSRGDGTACRTFWKNDYRSSSRRR